MEEVFDSSTPIRVSIVAIPDVMLSTLSSIYDALNSFDLLEGARMNKLARKPFATEVVGLTSGQMETASGLPVSVHRSIDQIHETDIVIIPSMMVPNGKWEVGRYSPLVRWLSRMHAQGARLCSACSGVLLLAETGLLDGEEATVHWAYARTFTQNFPDVKLRVEKVLVISGHRQEFVMSGASASWHDLVLHLVARDIGEGAAHGIAKFMLLQWHADGQSPFAVFAPPTDHGDAIVLDTQRWIEGEFRISKPVQGMVERSQIPERTFKRRFKRATNLSPIVYVQHLRIETAKQLLERSETPIDQVSWDVGYEDPASFRRLFKRIVGLTPGAYRRKFRLPGAIRGRQS